MPPSLVRSLLYFSNTFMLSFYKWLALANGVLKYVSQEEDLNVFEWFYLVSFAIYQRKMYSRPWLVWLNGLSAGLQTKGSLVQFPIGHIPPLQARSPVGGTREATTHWCFFPSLSPSFPLCLKINKCFFKKRKKNWFSDSCWSQIEGYMAN